MRTVGFLSLRVTQGHIFPKNQVLHFGLSQDAQPLTMKEPPVSALGELTIQSGAGAAGQIIYTCGNGSKLLLVLSVHSTHLWHLLSPVPGDTKANTKIYQIYVIYCNHAITLFKFFFVSPSKEEKHCLLQYK